MGADTVMLSDAKVRALKPGDRARKVADTGGLYVYVSTTGARSWRWDYRHGGKRRTLTLGRYPDVTLAQARERHLEARRALADGRDPGAPEAAVASRSGASLRTVAADWIEAKGINWTERHRGVTEARIATFGALLRRPVAEIEAPEILAALKLRSPYIAHRLRQILERVFAFAIGTGRAKNNPAAAIRGVLDEAPPVRHRSAIIKDPEEARAIYRMLAAYGGDPTTRALMAFQPLIGVRPGEARGMRWGELSGDTWTVPEARTKMRRDHVVPLPLQAKTILEDLRPLTGHGLHVFSSMRTLADGRRALSDMAVLAAYRRLGIDPEILTPHGWRAMLRTIGHENLGIRPEVLELILGHHIGGPLGRAYNRVELLPERRSALQTWADWLTG